MIIKDGHYQAYENWLSDLVVSFGSVHHFMYKNDITMNYSKYFDDAHHTFSSTQELIVHKINTNHMIKNENFGLLLNKDNIKKQLLSLRDQNGIKSSID